MSSAQARADPGIWFGGGGPNMTSSEREPIQGLGGLGAMPQWGPGTKPRVRGQSIPEADAILAFWDCICEVIFTFNG